MAASQPWLLPLLSPTRRHRWHRQQRSPTHRRSLSSHSSHSSRSGRSRRFPRPRSSTQQRQPSLPRVSHRATAPPAQLLLLLLLQARPRRQQRLRWRPWHLRQSAERRW